MHDAMLTRETFTYECQRCDNVWTVEYHTKRGDWFGEDWVAYFVKGSPAAGPRAGAVCPGCGDLRTVIIPNRGISAHDDAAPYVVNTVELPQQR